MGTLENVFSSVDNQYGFRVLREGGDIFAVEIRNTLFRDAITVVISFSVIFLYMWFHTKSFFLTFAGFIHMFLSFPPIIWLYRLVFGNAMQIMNVVSLWIILGIGADDVFVFVDTWKQWQHAPQKASDLATITEQLSWSWRKSCTAMLVTSLTTAAGFYSTAISRLLPLREFGFFLGGLVVVNYLYMLTYFPAVVVLHQKYQLHCCRAIRKNCIICKDKEAAVEQNDLAIAKESDHGNGNGHSQWHRLQEAKDEVELQGVSRKQSEITHRASGVAATTTASTVIPAVTSKGDRASDSLLGDEHEQLSDVHIHDDAPSSGLNDIGSNVPPVVNGAVSGRNNPRAPSWCPTGEMIMIRFSDGLYRLRWVVLLLTLILVVLLSLQIPHLRPPTDLPQLLPSDSNIEMLRATKKQLQCDNCWQGQAQNNGGGGDTPPVCPISVCGDPSGLARCEGIICLNGGYCSSGNCICPIAWLGSRCEQSNPCANVNCGVNGYCTNGQCQCVAGWSGSSCQNYICANVYCGSHGSCNTYTGQCSCQAGWSGASCSTYDQCYNVYCGTHGTCNSGTGACVCQGGWYGAQCQSYDICYGIQCGAHGSCSPQSGQCVCQAGWSGSSCTIQDLCYNVYCGGVAHGTCNPATGACVCVSGYSGPQCASYNPCWNVTCSIHGTCMGGTCLCTGGWSGPSCSIPPLIQSSTAGMVSSTGPVVATSTGSTTPRVSSTAAFSSTSSAVGSTGSPAGSGSTGQRFPTSIPYVSSTGPIGPTSSPRSTSPVPPQQFSSNNTPLPPVISSTGTLPVPSSTAASRSSSSTGSSIFSSSSSSTGSPTPVEPPKPISADLSMKISLLWGVASVDMSAADLDNKGVPIWLNTFDLTQGSAQIFLSDVCTQLMSRSDIRKNGMSRCVMGSFKDWCKASGTLSFPITQPSYFMSNFLTIFKSK